MIRRLLQQFSGGASARRPARGGRRSMGRGGRRSSGGTGARIGASLERYLRSRR